MSTEAAPKSKAQSGLQLNKKWGKDAIDLGYLVLPNSVLRFQHELGLDPVDLNIVIQIASYWWDVESPPWPSKKAIADSMRISESTLRKRLKNLESVGIIKRKYRFEVGKGQQSTAYELSGLIRKLTPIVQREKLKKESQKTAKGRRSQRLAEEAAV